MFKYTYVFRSKNISVLKSYTINGLNHSLQQECMAMQKQTVENFLYLKSVHELSGKRIKAFQNFKPLRTFLLL